MGCTIKKRSQSPNLDDVRNKCRVTPTLDTEEEKQYVSDMRSVQKFKTLKITQRKLAFRNAIMMSKCEQDGDTQVFEVEKTLHLNELQLKVAN